MQELLTCDCAVCACWVDSSSSMILTRATNPFDTYFLRVFRTLMTVCGVSGAAARLDQSQPAASAAFNRLPDILGHFQTIRFY